MWLLTTGLRQDQDRCGKRSAHGLAVAEWLGDALGLREQICARAVIESGNGGRDAGSGQCVEQLLSPAVQNGRKCYSLHVDVLMNGPR
jgi:hypothetical protein